MSSSDKVKEIKVTLAYLVITLSCAAFAAFYTSKAHGVTSAYMTFLFMYPLAAGIIVCISRKLGFRDRIFVNALNASAAAFGAFSCIEGIFAMAKTSSDYMPVFLIIGTAAFLAAVIRMIFVIVQKSSKSK